MASAKTPKPPLAPVPDANGVIHACYETTDDDPHPYFLRKATCGKKETQVDWNIQGVKGDKGDQGIQGIQGDKGDQGIQGIQGDKGDQGGKGDKGDAGAAGTSAVYVGRATGEGTIGVGNTVPVFKDLPAGLYAITATIHVEDRDSDDDRLVSCSAGGDSESTILPDQDGTFPFNQVITLVGTFDAGANGARLNVLCTPILANNTTWFTGASIIAIKVDSIG